MLSTYDMLLDRPSGLVRMQAMLAAFIMMAAVALSWHFFAFPLQPWPDQGWVLQAAMRLAAGSGLTGQSLRGDLAVPESEWLVYFPPLYPVVVAALLKTGLSVGATVKLLNFAALVVGAWGWTGLASSLLREKGSQVMFALLLVFAGGALIPKGGTTDYLYWAGMPYWIGAMLESWHATERSRIVAAALKASIITMLLIGVRWAALALVPIGIVILVVRCATARRWNYLVTQAAAYAGPATLSYLALVTFNRLKSSGGGTVLSYIEPRWQFEKLATLYPFEAMTTIPLALEPLLKRVWRALDPGFDGMGWVLAVKLGIPLMILGWAVHGSFRRRGSGTSLSAADWTLGLTILGTVGFLVFMSLRYTWVGVAWSYLDEPRYFRPFWPAAGLLWLGLLGKLTEAKSTIRRIVVVLLGVCMVYTLQASVRWEIHYLTVPDPARELAEKIRSLPATGRLQVVFDNDVSDYLIIGRADLNAYAYPDVEAARRLHTTKPADIWIVRRVNENTAYVLDPDYDRRRVAALVERFDAKFVWRSSEGSYELFLARVDPTKGS